ncbi:hypothetical protein UP10_21930 [Bradyrhizobium sp. LTSPM299]|uniref:hypothetical protein n=1 Tax=Bradyrhizobium sp. LTSPM299 TaxID=1619233 RepID=UPI0005CAFD26|nr:hypothetical protein [Bradyrhizobium sp. LTSPM299]KJC58735.1 hypothetical protein UP10_21930 [Bradyrhizobium sp. LTSPM299]
MATKPNPEFGRRRPAAPPQPGPPVKRSNHVALLVMGTLAVGGSAYALMPRQTCQPPQPPPPGIAAPAVPQPGVDCAPRNSSSSGGHGGSGGSWSSRSSFFSSDSSSGGGSSSSSAASASSVSRGGFGSFAHAFGFGGG